MRKEETGLDHFEARDYDSRIARWLNPDPAVQHWSPYLAVGNNPVSGVDPDGREWIDEFGFHVWYNGSFTRYATLEHRLFHRALMLSPLS